MTDNEKPPMTENKGLSFPFCQKKNFENNENSIWLASTVVLHRNIEKFKFPVKIEGERRKQIITTLSKELFSNNLLEKPALLLSEELLPWQKEFVAEHFLSNQSFIQAHSGEAFVVDETGEFLATINIGDHLCLEVLEYRGELESAWNRLVAIETTIGKSITYTFSPKFGFLTADSNQCGTALTLSIFLQLSALIHLGKIDDILEKYEEESITITGIQGNPTEIIGDVLVIQNKYTLGLTEENIIAALRSFTTKLLVEENRARAEIRDSNNEEIKDKISRAFGILLYSYQIEAVEALDAISLLKLGVHLGWIKGLTTAEINNIFYNCGRAHLIHQHQGTLAKEEVRHKRAEFIHKFLKNATLLI